MSVGYRPISNSFVWRDVAPEDYRLHRKDWRSITISEANRYYLTEAVIVVWSSEDGGERAERYYGKAPPAMLSLFAAAPPRYYLYDGARASLASLGAPKTQEPTPATPLLAQRHWIVVRVIDEWGDPVAELGVTFALDDGSTRSVTTDARGVAIAFGVPPPACWVTLGKLVFYTSEDGVLEPTAVATVTLGEGETLDALAKSRDLHDGRTIYWHPANEVLRGKRASYGRVAPGDEVKVPKKHRYRFATHPDGEDHEYVLRVPASLDITRVDHHFAPKAEAVEIQYALQRMANRQVMLRVESGQHGVPLYQHALTPTERADGAHVLKWDGLVSNEASSLKGRYIHPLLGPFRVTLEETTTTTRHYDTGEFWVLYHSLVIRVAPWTADGEAPPESDQKAWLQYRLNELGYWGGPVGHDFDDYLKKAIIRYKANHPKFVQRHYGAYHDTVSPDLLDALRVADCKRVWMSGDDPADPKGLTHLHVEALTYQEPDPQASIDEFDDDPVPLQRARLNRPLLPLAALPLLVSRTSDRQGSGVEVPEAVGPVRVHWTWSDADRVEDDLKSQFAYTPARPSRARAYLRKAFLDVYAERGNAPKDVGGIEETVVEGSFLAPAQATRDTARNTVWSDAVEDADATARFGRSTVLFRTSTIAGDDFRADVRIELETAPDPDALRAAHGLEPGVHIVGHTGTLSILRSARVTAVIDWTGSGVAEDWDSIRREYACAHVDLDVSSVRRFKIRELLTDAEYRSIVSVSSQTVFSFAEAQSLSLRADQFYPEDPPAPAPTQTAQDYEDVLTALVNNFRSDLQDRLRRLLVRRVAERTGRSGIVIVNTAFFAPITNSLLAHKLIWVTSIGMPNSWVWYDIADPDHYDYVVGHEIGHLHWLRHWENAGDTNPDHHDQADRNCAMSYSSDSAALHQKLGVFSPHFCGKCNLRLRGWDVTYGLLPSASSP